MPVSLQGLTIMVVEDEFLAALDLKRLIEERDGKVAGPVGRLEQAQQLARSVRLDGAILDVKLDGTDSLALADELIARDVPIILVTGYDVARLPERFASTPRLPKPFEEAHLTSWPRSCSSAPHLPSCRGHMASSKKAPPQRGPAHGRSSALRASRDRVARRRPRPW